MLSLLCLINRHAVARLSVHFDGQVHRGACKRCGREMVFERGPGWKAAGLAA